MLFSLLIASVSAEPTNTTGIDRVNITNRCGVDGAMDHEFVVTLKPPPADLNGRRLDTTQDKLSYLQGWVHQYDPEDTSNGTSNDATRRKLEANSNSTHIVHLFTETQFAVAISADDDVRLPQHAPTCLARGPRTASLHNSHTDPRARIRPLRSWPMTGVPGAAVVGYEAVDAPFTRNHWGGLQRTRSSSALLDGSSLHHSNWWYAVGARKGHRGGIPGPDGIVVSQTELYVHKPCASLS